MVSLIKNLHSFFCSVQFVVVWWCCLLIINNRDDLNKIREETEQKSFFTIWILNKPRFISCGVGWGDEMMGGDKINVLSCLNHFSRTDLTF